MNLFQHRVDLNNAFVALLPFGDKDPLGRFQWCRVCWFAERLSSEHILEEVLQPLLQPSASSDSLKRVWWTYHDIRERVVPLPVDSDLRPHRTIHVPLLAHTFIHVLGEFSVDGFG